MTIHIILACLLHFGMLCTQSMQTLTDLQSYADSIPEFPEADNYNWNDPDYHSFYETLQPNFLSRWLNYFGMRPTKNFNMYDFKELLWNEVERRERKNLSGRHVAKISIEQPAQLYVMGDVQGSFHSLVRILSFLQKQNVLKDSLKIKDRNTYIIFNGDLIDRSAYSLESLYTAMLLQNKNPNNVVYIRGRHEDKNYWHNFGLKRELMQRAKHMLPVNAPSYEIPLGDLISRFFDTLPLALYINTKEDPWELIRISHLRRDTPEIKELLFGDFLSSEQEEITYYDIRIKKKSPHKPKIQALITTEDWIKEHRSSNGLGLLDQDQGTTSWSIVSTPIMAYQKYYHFFFDAVVKVDVQIPISNSTITLWNNDIKTTTHFEPKNRYILTSSIPIDSVSIQEKQKPEITIGSTMALKRGLPIMGQRTKRGMDLRINEENQRGGINGRHIKSIVYNDDYTPFLARQNIARLVNTDKVNLILLPIGSPTLESYIDYVKNKLITVLFPITGASKFRTPELTQLINLRPTYDDEVAILLEYLFTEYGARKFLFFYQDDAYGVGPLTKAHDELKARGITDWIDVPYVRGEVNLQKQADIIKSAQVDAIGLFSVAKPTEELFRQVGIDALSNKKIFGISPLGVATFRETIKSHGLEVLLGAAVPNPVTSSLEIVQKYRKAMDQSNLPYDAFSLESFIATSLLIDMMKRIKGPITNKKILEKLESLYDDKFYGLTLTYNPATRSLARYVWIETKEDEDWMEQKINNVLN